MTSAQNLRWARLKRPPDHDYFCSDLGPDISHVEREEEVESADTKECKDWRLGRRIVELDVLAKGLSACGKCGLPLNLDHTKEIQTYGLGSLLKVPKKCKLRGERRDFIPVRLYNNGSPIH